MAHAKQRHFSLYEKIAQDHERIAAEREQERLAFEATSILPPSQEEYYHDEQQQHQQQYLHQQ